MDARLLPESLTTSPLRVLSELDHSVSFPAARLIPIGELAGKQPIPLGRVLTLIGSGIEAHVRLRSGTISKRHALVLNADGDMVIRDLGSRTGVLVNGQRIEEAPLRNGDVVRIGRVEAEVSLGIAAARLARRSPPLATLQTPSGQQFPVRRRVFVIGRHPHCELVVASELVARSHAAIFAVSDGWFIHRLAEGNETVVDGAAVAHCRLLDGARIRVATTELAFTTGVGLVAAPVSDPESDIAETETSATGVAGVPIANLGDATLNDLAPEDESESQPEPTATQTPQCELSVAVEQDRPPPQTLRDAHATFTPRSDLPGIPEWVQDAGSIPIALAMGLVGSHQPEEVPPTPTRWRSHRVLWLISGLVLAGAVGAAYFMFR